MFSIYRAMLREWFTLLLFAQGIVIYWEIFTSIESFLIGVGLLFACLVGLIKNIAGYVYVLLKAYRININ